MSQPDLKLQLRTLGGLSLSRGTENLTGAVTQRLRLAILVLLGTAGEAGMSRDKLQAYLWAESDVRRARHVLNQLLYAQRRQVGEQSLFLGRKTLRLNPLLIWADVVAFEDALRRGDLEGAVALYRGPFLDGFFLKDAPEFERWADDQRAALARKAVAALTTLAERAGGAGDHRGAADWWRHAARVDPYDSRTALALVLALAAAGDRAGALVAARRHVEALRRDLGVAPGPAFEDAVSRLG
jgi:serine/threonine-protein kinase